MSIDFHKIPRGPGYFKFNNSLLLDSEYKSIIKRSLTETVTINNEANANVLWEIIKGTIRNETIKYATYKKRKESEQECKLNKDIELLENRTQNTSDLNTLDHLQTELNAKRNTLTELIDKRINGYIIISKAQYLESNERNSKLFSSLEKKEIRK